MFSPKNAVSATATLGWRRRCTCLCLLWAGAATAAGAAPVQLPFDFAKAAIEIDVAVNGQTLHMLLDTGVDPSVIDLAVAEKLGLAIDRGDAGEASGFGDGAGATVFSTAITGLSIAAQDYARFEALATDMRGISAGLGRKLDGVLGYSFLSDKVVLIDYPARRLVIAAQAADVVAMTQACKTQWATPLKTVDSFPVIADFRLGEAHAPVSLDTGSTGYIGLFGSASTLRGVSGALHEAGSTTRTGARGQARSVSYTFDAPVGFGPFSLPPGVRMSTYADAGSTSTRVANVGNRLLDALGLKVLLDYKGQQLAFYGDCSAD